MTDTSAPAYRVPGSKELRRFRMKRAFVVMGTVVLLLIVALSAFMLIRPIRESISAREVSAVLPGAEFFSDSADRTDVYAIEGGKYVMRSSGPLIIASVNTAQGTFRIVRAEDGFYEIRNGDRVIVRSKTALTGLDSTPDGAYLAYAQQSEAAAPLSVAGGFMQFLTLKPSEWNVIMLDVESNVSFTFGEGVQPFFVDETHVARTGVLGIHVTDTKTGESRQLLEESFAFVSFTPLVSPDRTLMGAVAGDSKSVSVYRVSPDHAEKVASIPLIERVTSYALGNDALFMLRSASLGMEVWKQSFGLDALASLEGSLPAALLVSRISNK